MTLLNCVVAASAPAAVIPPQTPPGSNADGRAYEVVTPADKGSRRLGHPAGGGSTLGVLGPKSGIASADGEALMYLLSVGILDTSGQVRRSSETDPTVMRRDEQLGRWIAEPANNLEAVVPGTSPIDNGMGVSADLSALGWWFSIPLFPATFVEGRGQAGIKLFGDSGGEQGSGWYDWSAGTALPPPNSNAITMLFDDTGHRGLVWGDFRGLMGPADPSASQTAGWSVYRQEPLDSGARTLVQECSGAQGAILDEEQVVNVTASTGSFTLALDGRVTVGIGAEASAGDVQAALVGLNNVGPADLTVSGDAGGPWTVSFAGAYSGVDVPELVADGTALSDGTASVVTAEQGSSGDATLLPSRVGDGAATDEIGVQPCAEGAVTSARGAVAGAGGGVLAPASNSSSAVLVGTATRAMSADGRRVFFMSPDPLVGGTGQSSCGTTTGPATACPSQVFVRQRGAAGDDEVRWLSRSRVPGQQIGLLGRGAAFESASRNGDVVYFRTNAPLTADDPNGLPLTPTDPRPVMTGAASFLSWDLYRYEFPEGAGADPASGTLTRVTAGPTGNADPNTNCSAGSTCTGAAGNQYGAALRYLSDDGNRAYFVTASPIGSLTDPWNSPPAGSHASNVPGGATNTINARNLYLYDHSKSGDERWKFIARLPMVGGLGTLNTNRNNCATLNPLAGHALTFSPNNNVTAAPASCVRGTPAGDALVFETAGQLTADDPNATSGDVYVYDADDDRLVRISAPPNSAAPTYACGTGFACNADLGFSFGVVTVANERVGLGGLRQSNVSVDKDGELDAVYFESRLELMGDDTNGSRYDVYQWRPGDGLALISPGDTDDDSYYSGNGADGETVFFTTTKRIDPREVEDSDVDVYAARVGGGFPFETSVLCDVLVGACEGSRGGTPDSASAAGSASFIGPDDQDDPSVGVFNVAAVTTAQRRQLARSGRMTLRVRVPHAGRVAVRGLRVRGTSRAVSKGLVLVPVRLTRGARRALARQGRLTVKVAVAFDGQRRTVRFVLRRAR